MPLPKFKLDKINFSSIIDLMFFRFNPKQAARLLFLVIVLDLACFSSTVLHNNKSELIGQQAQNTAQTPESGGQVDSTDPLQIAQSPQGLMKYLGKFKVTFYWIVEESEYHGPKNTPLYLEDGKILGYFSSAFVSDLKKEACAELKGGKHISYLKRVNKVRVVREFLGINGYTISPLKSIAVDPDIIPLGSKLYIPEFTKLKDYPVAGRTDEHNGVVYAHDIGSMINGHSIDIFVGYKAHTKLLTNVGIESSNFIDVYLLE